MAGSPRHLRHLPRRIDWRRGLVVFSLAVLLLVAVLGMDALALANRVERFPFDSRAKADSGIWLVVGTDDRSRAPQFKEVYREKPPPGGRADIILLLRATPAGVQILSLPRDLQVGGTAHPVRLGLTMLHSEQNLADALCSELDIPVAHMIVVDMAALVAVVDALGGVEVEVAHPTRDPAAGVSLPAGHHLLSGRAALGYVRSRKAEVQIDGTWVKTEGEKGALARQMQGVTVAQKLLRKLRATRNPITWQQVAWAASGGLTLDAQTSSSTLTELLRRPAGMQSLTGQPVPGEVYSVAQTPALKAQLHDLGFTGKCKVPGNLPFKRLTSTTD